MEDDLPSEYDVIVLGTGLVESIVAAAASRCGKKVLHLDRNSYYGQLWATLNLEQFVNVLKCGPAAKEQPPPPSPGFEDATLLPLVPEVSKISQVVQEWCIPVTPQVSRTEEERVDEEAPTPSSLDDSTSQNAQVPVEETPVSVETVESQSRKFNIDLLPKIIYSQGPMVQLLIESKVSRYMEFLNVTNVLAFVDSAIHNVPCSKSDVFSSKELSVIDKRVLMKQFEVVVDPSNHDSLVSEWNDKTFAEYLKSKKLSGKLYHYILHSIAMSKEDTPFVVALDNIREFIKNLGHYGGNSPFLWPLYGSGELLQAFCRLCAVYGGIYHLNRGADFILIDEDNLSKGVISKGALFSSKYVVLSASLLPSDNEKLKIVHPPSFITRSVLLTDRSLSGCSKKESVCVLNLPAGDKLINIVEVSSNSGACPKGFYVVHVTVDANDCDHDSLLELLQQIFTFNSQSECKPKVLFYAFFKIEKTELNTDDNFPKNVQVCSGVTEGIDFKSAIEEAKRIFQLMYPCESFLDPMPDPESDNLS